MILSGDDVRVALPLFQGACGGANPTSPLQEFRVYPVNRKKIVWFIEKYHYSHNMVGVKDGFCFALKDKNLLIGAMVFGQPATRGVDKHYGGKGNVVEIRRLVCIDNTPKNTESFFIGYVIRWLKKYTTYKTVLAYSDLEHGHTGVVYHASNFKKVNQIPGAIKIEWNGREYHDRSMRVKYNGRLKPFAEKLSTAYRNGEAKTKTTAGKNVWIYEIKR